ncbi:uncharacterized protein [Lolium perenne]|uniref:uncharacterized protein isoform X3 n=1 Tax=Lolium perenne TaxID=4522 RepID=UPI003A992314
MTLQRRASWCSSHLKQGTWNNGTFVLRGQGTKRLILFPICYSEVKDPEISRAKPSSTGWADSDLFYIPINSWSLRSGRACLLQGFPGGGLFCFKELFYDVMFRVRDM